MTESPSVKKKKSKSPPICFTDPMNPPPVGPYGSLVWDAEGYGGGRWKYKLNPRGSKEAAKWLGEYLTPLRMARTLPMLRPTFHALIQMGVDECDIEGELMIALVDGIARWNPDRGGVSTVIAWQMKRVLSQMIQVASRTLRERQGMTQEDADDFKPRLTGMGTIADPKTDDYQDPEEIPPEVHIAIRGIACDRVREVFLSRFMDRKKLEDIGKNLGVTKERARQLANRGMSHVQAALGYPIPEYHPDLHGSTPRGSVSEPFTQAMIDRLIREITSGTSVTKAARLIGRPCSTVQSLVKKLRLDGRLPKKSQRSSCQPA